MSNSSQTDGGMDTSIQTQAKLKLGYYQLRGRAQVPRLLLEFLKVPYEDELFKSNKEWLVYRNQNQKKWPLIALPYLIDGDVRITETVPICYYILNKYGMPAMLGKSLQEAAILDMYCWSIDTIGIGLAALCWAQGTCEQLEERKARFWRQNVEEKMEALEDFLGKKQWMLGNLSLFDFSIYQLIHYVAEVFPLHIKHFPRLINVERRVAHIPEIKAYESSPRAVKALLPRARDKN